ncbi:MAG: ADOP family duplicated permease [Vicinamibacterales bacterium]
MLDAFAHDLRWSLRLARRRPVASAAIVLTLALTTAAATAAYGVATAVLWRDLPFADGSRLVLAWERVGAGEQAAPARATSARYATWRDRATLTRVAVFAASGLTLEGPDGATAIRGLRVTANYFDVLGIGPALGRTFVPEDAEPGRPRVVVLAHDVWQHRFGGRASLVGDTIRLAGEPYTVIGVMPPEVFPAWPVNPAQVLLEPDLRQYWVPIAETPAFDAQATSHVYGVLGRLAAGSTAGAAEAELDAMADPRDADPHGAVLHPLREQFVRDARTPLLTLLAAAIALVLIACANLAALQVTATEARRGELATRAAIGAGRARIAQQVVVEALVLAALGGLAGVPLAAIALRGVPALLPPGVPLLTTPSLDFRVALFAAGIALACGLVVAAWPVIRVSGRAPLPRGAATWSQPGIYRALIVAQVALTMALAVSAGLLSQSLWSVRGRDAGFVIDDVLVADVGLPDVRYQAPGDVVQFEDRVLGAVAALPGVRRAALAYDHPLEANWTNSYAVVGGASGRDQDARDSAQLRIVSPGYFAALGVELLAGRYPEPRDDPDAPGVAVVNEAFVRHAGFAPVIGRTLLSAPPRFTWGDRVPASFEIVGVVEDERFRGLEEPSQPAVYLSTRQFPQTGVSLIVRTAVAPGSIAGALRAAVRGVDAGATVSGVQPLQDILDEQLVTRRVTTDVIGGIALLAVLLAALGLYGLLVVAVTGRARELAVRLALGAAPGALARHVLGDSLRPAAIGVGAGLLLALWSGRLLEGLLVDVGSGDPLTMAVVAATLLAVAAGAGLAPARRAARVDPARALRGD